MRNLKTYLFLGVAAAALTACQNDQPLRRDLGNSTEHNAAVQVIDPNPVTANAGAPDMNGARAGIAMDNYENANVKTTEAEATSSF